MQGSDISERLSQALGTEHPRIPPLVTYRHPGAMTSGNRAATQSRLTSKALICPDGPWCHGALPNPTLIAKA